MFLEKRVYQGSSGKIYPYPTIDKIYDDKIDKAYQAVFLENQYLKIMILPELGGRIQRAYDKTNDYDFVYYNQVIKPALVGLTGPWISGGIEFNWPQHHRPTTFSPVDYKLEENKDGSKTVLIHDVDQMYGTKGITKFTLYPDKAYIEIEGQVYNRTPYPQTFLWWANPAVSVNDHTQSIFPPDVHAVMDHGKRDVSRFPIATGVYYKHDYSEGVDISRYKNIPVPTSYMAEKSDYDFVGGYDHSLKAGILHVADHHVSPGKKQWTWGCGDFGKAWDRNLTDEDGPYIELMTGIFTDNQPDFTWLKPFEEKTFKQYFMPYKAVGEVKNATIDAIINLEAKENEVYLCAYASSYIENARIVLKNKGDIVFEKTVVLSPIDTFEISLSISYICETDLEMEVWNQNQNKLLVSYAPQAVEAQKIPEPAKAANEPEKIKTNDELYLIGLHLEQYRHASYRPDDYYLEGLKRDKGDIRINNAYGSLLMRRGNIKEAETYFKKALERLTERNPNPYNSEVYYNLGLAFMYQGENKKSYDVFYKATWTSEQQEMSFYYLAAIATKNDDFNVALEHIEKSLIKNTHNIKARGLKAYILRKTGRQTEATCFIKESLKVDAFDYLSKFELALSNDGEKTELVELQKLMRNFAENSLMIARDYIEIGGFEEAIIVLKNCSEKKPMLKYYEGYCYGLINELDKAKEAIVLAEQYSSDYCFPNKLEDIMALKYAISTNPTGAKAYYYLGNLFYDKLQWEKATLLWEKSVDLDNSFPTVFRNLSLSYFNKYGRTQKAKEMLEKAFSLNKKDARIFLELDQIYKKLGMNIKERLYKFEENNVVVESRDDLYIEYITLLNLSGMYEESYKLIKNRKFHPWEGGEGKVPTQYTTTLIGLAKEKMRLEKWEEAKNYLVKALVYPENLGEGKLEGTKDNHIYYYLGCISEKLGLKGESKGYFEKATIGTDEPAGMMYYNDQPADMILFQGLAKLKLGKDAEAKARFYRLINYGEQHIFDEPKIEYFAVSLPDFLIFEDNLTIKNNVHCNYLMALGHWGLGNNEKAKEYISTALELEPCHFQCNLYKKELSEKLTVDNK
ncbi:MAG: DUF5107 domain-containing protein [Clostridiales bacterium]|nr:DUF5107 domain-containing protein [Clostridiales bacterium]